MANRVEGVTEKLLACAREEFLSKGFTNASLRVIAENAGTTPRSVYTRYQDKEGLFAALIEEAWDGYRRIMVDGHENYLEKPVEEQKKLFHDDEFERQYQDAMVIVIDYIYDHYDAFKLIVTCSEGTKYAGFMDELAEIEVKNTVRFIENTGNDALSSGRASISLMHMLCSAYVSGMFEIIRHDMARAEAVTYLGQMREFFEQGWDHLFNP